VVNLLLDGQQRVTSLCAPFHGFVANIVLQFDSEMPCLRARSAVLAPTSCSRRTAMICSSVNLRGPPRHRYPERCLLSQWWLRK
jgi:hypothetical protein